MSTAHEGPFPHDDPLLRPLERVTLKLEVPLFRWLRDPWLFLFYHSGVLAFWTLVLLGITGLYVTLFYRFGFEASYLSIKGLDANMVSRVVRSAHRYLGDLFLVFAVLHAWRMFVQNRFRGARWLGWVAGMSLLALTWVIGTTGFWMLADLQAQWLHAGLMQGLHALRASRLILAVLVPGPDNEGWMYMVTLFFVHVGLSIFMGLVYWLHIKHLNRPRWFPKQPLMVALLASAVLAAAVFPVVRQPMWDFAHWPPESLLNALYLLLLPDALNGGLLVPAALGLLVALLALPFWWRFRAAAPPVVLNQDACIGCTLCAQDCPYQALEMVPREGSGPKLVATLHQDRCVGCGVCVGSCPTDALHLPHPAGNPDTLRQRIRQAARPTADGTAPRVVFACYRHLAHNGDAVARWTRETHGGPPTRVVGVPCVAVLHPDVIGLAWQAGAGQVEVVGCPPEDCPERYGNTWLEGRLTRQRKPWLRRKWQEKPLTLHWVPPTEFERVLSRPEETPSASAWPSQAASSWSDVFRTAAWWKALALLVLLALLAVAANRWPYAGPAWAARATLDFMIEHRLGLPLEPAQPTAASSASGLRVWVDETPAGSWPVEPDEKGRVVLFARVFVEPGSHRVRAVLDLPGEAWTLLDQTQNWETRRVYALHFRSRQEGGDPERGRALFFEEVPGENTGCQLCHSLEPGVDKVGPSLANIGAEAANRVPGMSAEEYLYQSIVDPNAYVVPGYPQGVMPPNYREFLSEQDIRDLVAFLLTLRQEQ